MTVLKSNFFLLVTISILSSIAANAELTDYEKRELHRHEQCADQCQITLDKRVFQCMKDREDPRKEEEQDCEGVAWESFRTCMKYCPVDPRKLR